MALFGMQVSSGADFRDMIKFDARAGRLFRVDRDPITGLRTPVDITGPETQFAIDFGTLEVGYVQFTANGPVRSMVPYGRPLPAQPQDKDENGRLLAKPGFYALVAGRALGGVREWCSNAVILLTALDELYQVFAQRREAQAGQIPLICIPRTLPVKSGRGAQSSTNYKPILDIVGWVDRVPDMGERTVPIPPSGAAPTHEKQASSTLQADAEWLNGAAAQPAAPAQKAAPDASGMPF